jgi:hypothetical protein
VERKEVVENVHPEPDIVSEKEAALRVELTRRSASFVEKIAATEEKRKVLGQQLMVAWLCPLGADWTVVENWSLWVHMPLVRPDAPQLPSESTYGLPAMPDLPFRVVTAEDAGDEPHRSAAIAFSWLWQRARLPVAQCSSHPYRVRDGMHVVYVLDPAAERPDEQDEEQRIGPAPEPVVHLPPALREVKGAARRLVVVDLDDNEYLEVFDGDGVACDEPQLFRLNMNGRLMLTEQSNAFIEIIELPDGDGEGFCARLKADPEHLVGDGATVVEALEHLGARCAQLYSENAELKKQLAAQPVPQPTAQAQPLAWSYRRKSKDELDKLALDVATGTVHLSHGQADIERDWPALVSALRASGINEIMNQAKVVAFFEESAKAAVSPDGTKVFLSGDTLDAFDYARLQLCIDDARPKGPTTPAGWARIGAKIAELLVRTPAAMFRPR